MRLSFRKIMIISSLLCLMGCNEAPLENIDLRGQWATHGNSCDNTRGMMHISDSQMYVIVDENTRHDIGDIISMQYEGNLAFLQLENNNTFEIKFSKKDRATLSAAARNGQPEDIESLYGIFDITRCS